jgi:hypothetical protein
MMIPLEFLWNSCNPNSPLVFMDWYMSLFILQVFYKINNAISQLIYFYKINRFLYCNSQLEHVLLYISLLLLFFETT